MEKNSSKKRKYDSPVRKHIRSNNQNKKIKKYSSSSKETSTLSHNSKTTFSKKLNDTKPNESGEGSYFFYF